MHPSPGGAAAACARCRSIDEAVDWERRVREESIRLRRYRRPVTVVLVELDGFERLVSRLGSDAADRLVPAIAETLVRNGRATDHVARLGPSRFGVLMPETDEIEAINYAERIRIAVRSLAGGRFGLDPAGARLGLPDPGLRPGRRDPDRRRAAPGRPAPGEPLRRSAS